MMNTYKIELSESEIKGIGASRWFAQKGKRVNVLAIGLLFWLCCGLIMALNSPDDFWRVVYGLLAVIPAVAYWYFLTKAFRRAGLEFLEMVKDEQ